MKEDSIEAEVQRRSKACKHFGPIFAYAVPHDAFSYPSVHAFKKAHPFVRETKTRKNCLIIRPDVANTTDNLGRFYTQANYPQQCKRLKGVFDETAYNRNQPPMKGVCWTNADDAKCGARVSEPLLLAKGTRMLPAAVEKSRHECEVDDECLLMKKDGVRDCMSLATASKIKMLVHEPPESMPAFITTPTSRITEYLHKWYIKRRPSPPPTTTPLSGTGNRCVTAPKDPDEPVGAPTIPQSVVNMVMKRIAMAGEATTSRGLLAWHSTGAGKTCTATGVIDAFWDSGREIIYVSSVDALASNPPSNFHACAYNLYPRFSSKDFDRNETMLDISRQFKQKNVRFLSFAKLANRVKKCVRGKKKAENTDAVNLNNAVLIIDEVHNLFRPLAHQRKQHEYLLNQLKDPTKFPHLKMVIMTATPGDTVDQVVRLLNMIRDPHNAPIVAPQNTKGSIEEFKKSIYGLVSYFDMSHDHTRFPKRIDVPIVRAPLTEKQLDKYLEAYRGMTPAHMDYTTLVQKNQLQKYASPARKYANAVFQFEADMLLHEFSSKLPALLNIIAEHPREKHYVYSSFYENRGFGGQGILAIARFLESELGYQLVTVKDVVEWEKKGALPPKRAKRYILATQKQIGAEGTGTASANMHRLLSLFNRQENAHGELVHVFLASQSFNEGLDLKAVRHVHFFEPLITMASDIQTVGRAIRNCSHKDLDMAKWDVTIHRYMIEGPKTATPPFEEKKVKRKLDARGGAPKKGKPDPVDFVNIEDQIHQLAREKVKDMISVFQAMREAAIDCRVLRDFHSTNQVVHCM
jgi:hypothetical protein